MALQGEEIRAAILECVAASARKMTPRTVEKTVCGGTGSSRVSVRSTIRALVEAGELDFSLVDIFLTREQVIGGRLDRYSFDPLLDEEVSLACSRPYYDQFIQGDHSMEKLEKLDFISYEKSSLSLRSWFKHHFKKNPGRLSQVLTVNSHQAVINAIQNHLGLGVVATPVVRKEIELGLLVLIRTGQPEVINKIALAQLQDKVPTLTERTFIKFMRQDLGTE